MPCPLLYALGPCLMRVQCDEETAKPDAPQVHEDTCRTPPPHTEDRKRRRNLQREGGEKNNRPPWKTPLERNRTTVPRGE